MIKNGPIGAMGGASSNGWITSKLFENWMHHFIKFAKPSLEDPVLLIMKRIQESFFSHSHHIQAINYSLLISACMAL